MQTVRTRIIKIGNSQGIRIPKLVLEQLGFAEEVELEVQDDQLVVRAGHQPRQGWGEQFARMAATGEDVLLDEQAAPSSWDEGEWEW